VILNQTLAERLFPNTEAVGESIRIGDDPKNVWEVVGIAADSRYRFLTEEPRNYYYAPLAQMHRGRATLHLRTSQSPATLASAVRQVVAGLDPHLPVYDVRTLAEQKDLSLWPQRFASAIIGLCGVITLGLAALGLYASLAYAVTGRTREIGIRSALGASRGDILAATFKSGALFAGTGLVIGLGLSQVFMKVLGSVLYAVAPAGVSTYAGAAALVLTATLVATYFPARRAARIDPMQALRHE
jgi:predicted lysophospholipase L1 biosynthesis ABC-type transport system permease subunit